MTVALCASLINKSCMFFTSYHLCHQTQMANIGWRLQISTQAYLWQSSWSFLCLCQCIDYFGKYYLASLNVGTWPRIGLENTYLLTLYYMYILTPVELLVTLVSSLASVLMVNTISPILVEPTSLIWSNSKLLDENRPPCISSICITYESCGCSTWLNLYRSDSSSKMMQPILFLRMLKCFSQTSKFSCSLTVICLPLLKATS